MTKKTPLQDARREEAEAAMQAAMEAARAEHMEKLAAQEERNLARADKLHAERRKHDEAAEEELRATVDAHAAAEAERYHAQRKNAGKAPAKQGD